MDSKTLIDRLSRRLEVSKTDVSEMIDALAAVMAQAGTELDSIAVPGFGTFEPKKRTERISVIPGSGKRMLIPPKIALTFKPSALLKQKLK